MATFAQLVLLNGGDLKKYPSYALTFNGGSSAVRAALVVLETAPFLGKAAQWEC